MVDKNVFTQELSKVFTILQEVRLVEKYIKELIDSNNLTEDKVVEFEEKLNQYKRDLDYINENTEQLQESLNQMNINLEDLMEYVDSIKDFINQNENTTEVGGNLEVDGNITINSVDNLITKDGSTFGGGGSDKYLHNITVRIGTKSPYEGYIYFSIPTNDETPITNYNNLVNIIKTINSQFVATGTLIDSSYIYIINNVYWDNSYSNIMYKLLRIKCVNKTIDDVEYKMFTAILNTQMGYTESYYYISDEVIKL